MKQESVNKDYYLKNVKLSGYKSIKNVDVDFERGLNIIIGKNASGKTNFMNFLHKLLIFFEGEIHFKNATLTYQSQNNISILYNNKINLNKDLFTNSDFFDVKYSLYENSELQKRDIDEYSLFRELKNKGIKIQGQKVDYGLPDKYFSIDSPIDLKLGNVDDFISTLHKFFQASIPLAVRKLLGKVVNDYQDMGFVSEDSISNHNNLLGKLSFIGELKSVLKEITPIEDIRYNPFFNVFSDFKNSSFTISNLFVEFKVGESWHPFFNLSDGTKRLFYIISEVYFSDEDSVILIEEPELGIHPHQLHDLMTFLKEEAENKQIIITTHSPLVLDILNEDELDNIIITKYENGETKMTHLSEKQKEKATQYMEQMYLSDYWKHSDLEE